MTRPLRNRLLNNRLRSTAVWQQVVSEGALAVVPSFQLRLTAMALIALLLVAADTPGSVIKKVREGVELFRSQKYSESETTFAEAAELAAENPVVSYDQACAALAAGDSDMAKNLFRKAQLVKDPELAVRVQYNLGCLEAGEARGKLGDDPIAVTTEVREEVIDHLLTAVRHYRDVLRTDRSHTEARHNLELVRVYIKHIQSKWAEHDRQKARDDKNLLQFLKMIEEQQTQLRSVTRRLNQEEDSVHKRQAIAESADSQRSLQEEIEPLQNKIRSELQPATGQPGAPAQAAADDSEEHRKKAEELLLTIAEDAGKQMLRAADRLQAKNLAKADEAQTESLNLLNQLYMAVAPYPELLQRSITEQKQVAPSDKDTETGEKPNSANSKTEDAAPVAAEQHSANDKNVAAVETGEPSPNAVTHESEHQNRISHWAQMLSLKAEQALPEQKQQLQTMQEQLQNNQETVIPLDPTDQKRTTSDEKPEDKNDKNAVEKDDPAAQQRQQQEKQVAQLEGLVQSMELAVKLAPDAEQHSRNAEDNLRKSEWAAADDEQVETLRILNEIAEPLKQEDDQQQQNDQQQNKNEQNKDDQQQKDGEKQDQQQQDQKDGQQKPSEKDEQQQQEKQQQRQAESTLRKAREREQQHRDMEKKLRALLQRGFKVDKDW